MIPEPNFPPHLSPRESLELQIIARLLGELPASDAVALDEAIQLDPELAQLEARLRRSLPWIQAACRHPTPSAQPQIPSPSTPAAADETRRAAFLARLRHENPPSPTPLHPWIPPSESLAPTASPSPRVLSFPSLRWLALAASLVALFFVVSSALQPRQLQLTSFDLALNGAPTATSLGVPFTITNRDLLRQRSTDFGDFVVTPEGTVRQLGVQLAESKREEQASRRAANGPAFFADNAPATPSSASVPQFQKQETRGFRGGQGGAAREVRLTETPASTLDLYKDNQRGLHPAPSQVPTVTPPPSLAPSPSTPTQGGPADKSFNFARTAGPPLDSPKDPTVPTRGSDVSGRSIQPESSARATLAASEALSSGLVQESEARERLPFSKSRNRFSTAAPDTSTSLESQTPVPADSSHLADNFAQEDREDRSLISPVTALGRHLGELPELLTKAERPPSPALVFPPETLTSDQPLSTFSLNVADVSFQLAAASLAQGQVPPPHTIRTEEFINAFHYRDPEPAPGAPVGFAWERSRYPFAQQRDVLRLAVRTAAIGRDARQPLQVVLVIDASGSMERPDRIATLHAALQTLATQLGPTDRLSAVTFARTAHLVIDGGLGSDAPRLVERLQQIVPEGGTHLEEALQLGYETALRHFIPGGVNRVILFTDGAANLGELQQSQLQTIVESHRRRGIALDTFGIGWEGYDDERLAALARHGDGRYGFLNSPDDVASRFVRQLTGALEVAASDVKVQVEFHPDRVASWRQIGYAQHQLTAEQFRDDTVDAAELGAAESGNALYLIETLPQGSGPIATVRVRFRQPSSGVITEHSWVIPYNGLAPDLSAASPSLRLAVAAAGLGERLAGSPLAPGISIPDLQTLLQDLVEFYHPDPAPARLQHMLQQAAPLLSP